MSVTSVSEQFEGCSSQQEQQDLRVVGTAVRTFKVSFDTTDTLASKQVAALTASAGGVTIPAILEAHPVDANWFATSKTARPDISGVHWIVEVIYQYMENPLTRLAVIEWDDAEEPAIVERDIDGDFVGSSAGEAFDPPIMEMVHDSVGRINYASAVFDKLVAADYIDSVNLASLLIDGQYFPPYTVKINKWRGRKTYWGATAYWEVYLEIQIRLAYKPGDTELYGWRKQIVDQGFYKKGTFTGPDGNPITGKVPILNSDLATYDDDGEGINADDQITSPVRLDGNGGILADGQPTVFLYFETKKRRDFSIFNLSW